MSPAALGIRMHSGWGAAVVLCRQGNEIKLLDRRRVVVAAEEIPGAKQPYHFVEKLPIAEAEERLANFATASEQLALQAVGDLVEQVRGHGERIRHAGLLLASGRALPALSDILASHALIHTAEGEFFRRIARGACEKLHISVMGFKEKDLESKASRLFGASFAKTSQQLAAIGKAAGPPWTVDQKNGAWAALMSLLR
jgi:hypothetical protein